MPSGKKYPRSRLFKQCERCDGIGHAAAECPSYQTLRCTKCNGIGHGSWQCPTPDAKPQIGIQCYLCNEAGHWSKDCTNQTRWRCKVCNRMGHQAVSCGMRQTRTGLYCHGCGEVGHSLRFCSKATCFRCGIVGHIATTCPMAKRRGDANWHEPACETCGEYHDDTAQCPGGSAQPQSDKWRSPTPPPAYESTADDGPSHAGVSKGTPGDHLEGCKCMTCTLKRRRTVSPATAEEARCSPDIFGGTRADDHGAQSASHPRPTSGHGAECACKGRTKKQSVKKKTSPTHTPNPAAMALHKRACQEQDIETAIGLFTQCIVMDPKTALFYVDRAGAYMKTKKVAAALDDFRLAITIDGYSPTAETLVQTACCRLRLGSRSSALMAAREALALNPDHQDAQTLKRRLVDLDGHVEAYRSARLRNQWRGARTAYEACLRTYAAEDIPVPVEVRCWGVELSITESSWDHARKTVDELKAEKPKSVDVMLTRAIVLFLMSDLDEAVNQCVAALKLDPGNQRAKDDRTRMHAVLRLKQEGNSSFGDCKWGKAIECWDSALDLISERPDEGGGGLVRARLLLNKAQARLKLGQYSKGLRDVDASLKLDATNPKAFLVHGRIHAGLELFDSAIDDFNTALRHASSLAGLKSADIDLLQAELKKAEKLAAEARTKLKDYYKILGISPSCTMADIKKAYRTQSLKHHPDKGGIEEIFKLVNEAYTTLSDPEARWHYDADRTWRSHFGSSAFGYDDESDVYGA